MQFTNLPASFAGRSGRFYVLRNEGLRLPRKYATYSSVGSYDTRTEVPIYVEAAEALADFKAEVKIYAESLTTTSLSFVVEPDEIDVELIRARNMWAARLASAKARRHAV